jgi:hypothetical protein
MEEKTMTNKRNWLGMLVMVLVFGMTVVGCEEDLLVDEGLTLTFEVYNKNSGSLFGYGGGKVVKLEFINGNNLEAPIIKTETVNLSMGESATFKISGFTVKCDGRFDVYRAATIRVFYEDGTICNNTAEVRDNAPISVWCEGNAVRILQL